MNNDSVPISGLSDVLGTIARRVGADRALLSSASGRVHAAVGFTDPTDASVLAASVCGAGALARSLAHQTRPDAFVELAVPDHEARVYARRIVGDRILVTVFDSDGVVPCAVDVDPDALMYLRRALKRRQLDG